MPLAVEKLCNTLWKSCEKGVENVWKQGSEGVIRGLQRVFWGLQRVFLGWILEKSGGRSWEKISIGGEKGEKKREKVGVCLGKFCFFGFFF